MTQCGRSLIRQKVTHDDVEFCVNVDELSVVVDDRQRRDPLVHELPQRLDDGHRVFADLDVLVAADAQVVDRLREVFRLRQIVNLQEHRRPIRNTETQTLTRIYQNVKKQAW